jgi:AraC-like DNA-binding protein
MSRKRQAPARAEDGILVRTWATTHLSGSVISKRSFDWDQLAYASQGVMSVHTPQGMWVVPPHRAVWIPAGEVYRVEMAGRVAVRTLFFKQGISRSVPARCQAVNVSPLLRELVLETIRHGMLHRDVPAQARLARVILDQLEALPAVPLQLPMPRDPRARRAADLLCRDPGEPRSLALAARTTGASKRTLERLFRSETQMTFGRWRQRLRLIAALRSLAAGEEVTRVALQIGYNSPSAFIAAFRREMGTTPGRYFEPAA